jgi:hypothetical protein
MRFSTFAAFMLPLVALAAPTPQSSSTLESLTTVHQRFLSAFAETSIGIRVSVALAAALPETGLLPRAQEAEEKLALILPAIASIQITLQQGRSPSDAEYVDNPFARAQRWGQND